ncbi:MAG: 3-keto-5-aminohexanoate cleavage protein [Actinobacteria bacterium]|nr:3-keto-5-aminohexanoate cleavage protein [Actinomycetota bacterium]
MTRPKVIITCALTGGVHGKDANPNLPEQPDEIIEQGIAAWRAGAAVLHCHARDPKGEPTTDPAIFSRIYKGLLAETDAIINLTTGGGLGLSIEERIRSTELVPEICTLNMGLLDFILRGEEFFFSNHRSEITWFVKTMREKGIKPELECYNIAMIEESIRLIDSGLVDPPYLFNLVLNTPTLGGLSGTPLNVFDMVKRLPENSVVSVSSMGNTQLPITTIGMAMGLHVRVGLEDNVHYAAKELAVSNAQLVERAVRLAKELQLDPATPDETRDFVGLPRDSERRLF